MTKIEMKSKRVASRTSEMKHRRLFSAAAVLLAVCLAFVGAAGAEVTQENAVAKVGMTYYDSLSTAISEAPADSVVEVLKNVVLTNKITINTDNLTIIGINNENPIQISTNSGSSLYEMFNIQNNVTFKNLTISNTWGKKSGNNNGKCILISTGGITVNITNCNFETTATSGNPMPVYICSSGTVKSTVNLIGTTIDANKGYGIVVKSPVSLNIKTSSISGYGALYLMSGASGSTIKIDESSVSSVDNWGGANFGTIIFRDSNIKLSLENTDVSVTTNNNRDSYSYSIFGYYESSDTPESGNTVTVTGGSLSITGEHTCMVAYGSSTTPENEKITLSNVQSDIDISEYLDEVNYVCVPDGNGKFDIVQKELGMLVSPTELVFVELMEGYTQPTGQSVTLKNTGNVPLTLKALTEFEEFDIDGLESETILNADSTLTITILPRTGYSIGDYTAEIIIDTLNEKIEGEGNISAKVTAAFTVNPQASNDNNIINSNSGSGGSSSGSYLSFPRFTENGGLVDFGSSKVVKALMLPEGSSGSVVLKVDTIEKWPKELETEYTFDISVEKLGEGMAYIHFEISESTLESLGITPADICAYHLVDDVWVKLITTYEVKDGTVFYEAETDSFSPFKLVIEEGAAEPKAEETEPVIPPTEEPEDKPQEELPPIEPPVQPTEPESPSPILAVLAGLGAAAVLRRK